MKQFAELVVKVADLVEAEGRSLLQTVRGESRSAREYVATMGVALACLITGTCVLIGGCALIGVAAFLWIAQYWGSAAAAGVCGAGFLLLGGIGVWIFQARAKA